MRAFIALTLLILSALAHAATDQEIDTFMINVVEESMPLLPIVVDDQSRTTSIFYDTNANTLIYGVEVDIEGSFTEEQIKRTRQKARSFTSTSACANSEARSIVAMGVKIHYRYHTAMSKTDLFDYTITSRDCGTEI